MTLTLTEVPTAPADPAAPPALGLLVLAPRHAERVRSLAHRAGLAWADGADGPGPAPHHPGAVTVVVADDVEQALRCAPHRTPDETRGGAPDEASGGAPDETSGGAPDAGPLLIVCDTVTRTGLMLAVRAGAVVLRAADLGEESLAAAVRRAGHPHQSIPYPVLSRLLTGGPRHPREPSAEEGPALTARQTSVLRLMADGHHNADIARLLSCSEHTVKNVIYEVMSRLNARNRAHAVAHAVRHGLI
ncbi:LuxR C-terminal-related transcriptional regulator [Streptomyces sp. NPDC090108]|uniref:helix-turn-helix transcriptional regulator n=1 Tax=Streptomyces sp. NPDC090108 TaxID=3365947 RepID=UPI003818C06D